MQSERDPRTVPGDWELARRVHRACRLGCLHYQPRLARTLEAALEAESRPGDPRWGAPVPAPGRGRPREGEASGELTRSFVGALARLPRRRVGEIAALLEVLTFPQALRAALWPRRASRQTLGARWAAACDRLDRLDDAGVRCELVLRMRRRLGADGPRPAEFTTGGLARLEGLLEAALTAVAHAYGVAAGHRGPGLLQNVLLAVAREVEDAGPPGPVEQAAHDALLRMACGGAAIGAVSTLGYLGRRRLALTFSTLVYVVLTSLFGVSLPFEAYRWMAVALSLLLEPPVLAASLVGAESLIYSRLQRRFDHKLLGVALLATYQVPPLMAEGALPYVSEAGGWFRDACRRADGSGGGHGWPPSWPSAAWGAGHLPPPG